MQLLHRERGKVINLVLKDGKEHEIMNDVKTILNTIDAVITDNERLFDVEDEDEYTVMSEAMNALEQELYDELDGLSEKINFAFDFIRDDEDDDTSNLNIYIAVKREKLIYGMRIVIKPRIDDDAVVFDVDASTAVYKCNNDVDLEDALYAIMERL
jgi:hypothetical protein